MSTISSTRPGLQLLRHLVLLPVAALVLGPFAWMLVTAVKDPSEVLRFPPRWLPERKTYVTLPSGQEERVAVEGAGAAPGSVRARRIIPPSAGVAARQEEVLEVRADEVRALRWRLANLRQAWVEASYEASFARYFWVSALTALGGAGGVLLTSSLAAYALAWVPFRGRELLFSLLLGTMMVPGQVLLVPNFVILARLGWLDRFAALIVPWTATVFGIFFLRQFMRGVPRDLIDAARLEGCGHARILWHVALPVCRPALVTLGLLSFIGSWNGFLWPLIVTNSAHMRTVQVGLASLQSEAATNYTLLMAASAIAVAPLIVLFLLAQRQVIESFARTGLKG